MNKETFAAAEKLQLKIKNMDGCGPSNTTISINGKLITNAIKFTLIIDSEELDIKAKIVLLRVKEEEFTPVISEETNEDGFVKKLYFYEDEYVVQLTEGEMNVDILPVAIHEKKIDTDDMGK